MAVCVAVEHIQMRTKASVTVGPIDWPVPFTTIYRVVSNERFFCKIQIHATNRKYHGWELNPVPPAHETSALPMLLLRVRIS